MSHEHVMCQANDIEQRHLLGGNITKKIISDLFYFPLSFIFCILLYVFVIFLYSFSFISTLRTMLCLKCGGIWRILVFFVVSVSKKYLCFFSP
jgi:hypothetical protein